MLYNIAVKKAVILLKKIRYTYTKSKLALYLTNDDMILLFEKAFRRANINIKYNKKNKPLIEIASEIQLGIESTGEIAEVLVDDEISTTYFIKILNDNLPQGVTILSANEVEALDIIKLKTKVISSDYEIKFNYTKELLENKTNTEINLLEKEYEEKMKEYLSSPQILVTKRSKDRMEKIDIKPLVLDFKYDFNTLDITLASSCKQNLEPETLMKGFSEYVENDIYFDAKWTKINLG